MLLYSSQFFQHEKLSSFFKKISVLPLTHYSFTPIGSNQALENRRGGVKEERSELSSTKKTKILPSHSPFSFVRTLNHNPPSPLRPPLPNEVPILSSPDPNHDHG